ncbi:hypothetical protein [Thalassolituus pacificus]|uniref:Uncharacterized protein n=1 Tax=Thalassolituus pacificus TaxID=2975440 RepID=A0A9X2WBR5_9GAMM|nr:hypothetical protein [Thalassolituus pacificus]MCT7357579.1 hypothetical protein [Thalassolituus pacificus]
MAKMSFRFTTEVEVELHGDSYEEVYLMLKDMMRGVRPISTQRQVKIFPPEQSAMFFSMEGEHELHEIPMFKGDFKRDILEH